MTSKFMSLNVSEGIRQATEGINRYTDGVDSWRIAFSGGKDSTALLTLMIHLVQTGAVSPPDKVLIITSDTRQELPPLIKNAEYLSLLCHEQLGWETMTVRPPLEKSFLYSLLGRGLYTPGMNGSQRWCTRTLKTDPMDRSSEMYSDRGIDVHSSLLLYGSRVDESDARSARMQRSCALEGSECGSGLYTVSEGRKYAPLTNWRNCATWDWIFMAKAKTGYDPRMLMELYGSVEAKDVLESPESRTPEEVLDAIDATSRTGCIGCPVVSHDYALDRVCTWPQWQHLKPFLGLRPLYVELREHRHRLRKPLGETNRKGLPVLNQGRVGPIAIPSRLMALDRIREMQDESNEIAERNGLVPFILLSDELERLIRDAISGKLYPRGWDGSEPMAVDTRPVGIRIADAFGGQK